MVKIEYRNGEIEVYTGDEGGIQIWDTYGEKAGSVWVDLADIEAFCRAVEKAKKTIEENK